MSTHNFIIDLSKYNDDNDFNTDMIKDLTVPCESVEIQYAPGAPQAPIGCPASPKYSGDTITLEATPTGGIGPYNIEFLKNTITINPSRLGGSSNPILSSPEGTTITRIYTLNDLDISSASGGTIDFSVNVSDSCPTGSVSCNSTCTIAIGCIAPTCNFTVT